MKEEEGEGSNLKDTPTAVTTGDKIKGLKHLDNILSPKSPAGTSISTKIIHNHF